MITLFSAGTLPGVDCCCLKCLSCHYWLLLIANGKEWVQVWSFKCHRQAELLIYDIIKAFENPEDVQGGEPKKDEDVERVRRAHMNDLENIPAFLLAGFAYVMTEPQPDLALWLIRVAVIARILHTIVSL